MNNNTVIHKISLLVYVLTCVVCTVDTGLFVYPSLSRSILMEIGILCITFCAFIHVMFTLAKNASFRADEIHFYIVLWVSFIIVRSLLLDIVEEYRTIYLCITLFAILPLSYLLDARMLNRKEIEFGLILIAVIHLVYMCGQLIGVAESGNAYYKVTGGNENPSVTAIYLAGYIPLVAKRVACKEHRGLYAFIIILSLVAIILLRCRTAYFGLCIEFLVFLLLTARRYKNIQQVISKYKIGIAFAVMLLAIPICMRTYNMKRDSSDSRWLIWKLSAQMIAENPQGYGYGLFEKHYNLRQAEYFSSGKGTIIEKRTASFCNMAYNDYLEHGVEGGIVGGLFLIAFYVLLIVKSVRSGDMEVLCVVSGLAAMSLTNFVYLSMQPWWLLVCCAPFITTQSGQVGIGHKYGILLFIMMAFFFTIMASKVVQMTMSQLELKSYFQTVTKGEKVLSEELQSLKTRIGTSEAYWNTCAYNSMLSDNYADAVKYLDNASMYTSAKQNYMAHYIAYQSMGQESKGIQYIDTLCHIQPSLLRPKLLLMEYYNKVGDTQNALTYAKEILATKPRVRNIESSYIQSKASEYIETRR